MVWGRYVACFLFIVGVAFGAWACADECASGSEGCACKREGNCDAGLACVSDVCENLCPIPYRCRDENDGEGGPGKYLEECDPATGDFEVLHDCSAETAEEGDACRCTSIAECSCGHDRYYVGCFLDVGFCNGIQYEVPAPDPDPCGC